MEYTCVYWFLSPIILRATKHGFILILRGWMQPVGTRCYILPLRNRGMYRVSRARVYTGTLLTVTHRMEHHPAG